MAELGYSQGWGVVAGATRISSVGQAGLRYRGYDIAKLAETVCFEEVLHLLVYGELPTRRQLAFLRDTLMEFRRLPRPVVDVLRSIPTDTDLMDVLRTTVSLLGHYDPTHGDTPDDLRRRSIWLTASIASLIAARHRFVNRLEPLDPQPGLAHAEELLFQLHGETPDEEAARLIDLTLILYAEHDFNASTFTARVIASTRSDLVSAIVGAIGALKGPLHGGANERAMEMLAQFHTPDDAAAFITRALERKDKVMGFGHRVYRNGDHRAEILEAALRRHAETAGAAKWMAIYDAIKTPMVTEKGIHPNLDFPCALTYHLLNLPVDLYTPLFVASRVAGWCAHVIEQVEEDKLYRPLSAYVGEPPRPVPPMSAR
ncbi:MAG: bifunctional 2-methylcitrate synthase/citrate synthase [Phycisphaerales bacterium]|nr:bifunctional 2-methylcitrate synthase/citrate synthase [Phycisphaerales bacterium]